MVVRLHAWRPEASADFWRVLNRQWHESHGSVRFQNVNWSHGSVLTVRFQFPVRFRRFGSDIVRTVGTGSSEPKANRIGIRWISVDFGGFRWIWRDLARSGEIWRDRARSGEIWRNLARSGEMWQDVGFRARMARAAPSMGLRRDHIGFPSVFCNFRQKY